MSENYDVTRIRILRRIVFSENVEPKISSELFRPSFGVGVGFLSGKSFPPRHVSVSELLRRDPKTRKRTEESRLEMERGLVSDRALLILETL